MYQPKVKQTEEYSDSQGTHLVHKGKLILPHNKTINYIGKRIGNKLTGNSWVPIIISETEEIEAGEWAYRISSKVIKQLSKNSNWHGCGWRKILAFPEQLSNKQLQAIASTKIKNGNEVLIKCTKKLIEYRCQNCSTNEGRDNSFNCNCTNGMRTYREKCVHLNGYNRITLFPAEQSVEEAAKAYSGGNFDHPRRVIVTEGNVRHGVYKAFKAGVEWAKKNNH